MWDVKAHSRGHLWGEHVAPVKWTCDCELLGFCFLFLDLIFLKLACHTIIAIHNIVHALRIHKSNSIVGCWNKNSVSIVPNKQKRKRKRRATNFSVVFSFFLPNSSFMWK